MIYINLYAKEKATIFPFKIGFSNPFFPKNSGPAKKSQANNPQKKTKKRAFN
jgi:hypothetical protein